MTCAQKLSPAKPLAFEVASVEGGSTMTTDAGQRVEAGHLTSLRIVRRDKHKTHLALGVLGSVAVAALLDQHRGSHGRVRPVRHQPLRERVAAQLPP